MTVRTILLEVGSGNDWHGRDYTKAAVRAVDDAIHHSSLVFLQTLEVDPKRMFVDVIIGVQQPEAVDATVVKETLPHGQIAVKVVHGGLDVANGRPTDLTVIATAAVTVRFDFDEHLAHG
jgi:uncharacterized protein (TIGR02058 family)